MRALALLWLLLLAHYTDAETTNASASTPTPAYLTTLDPYSAAPKSTQNQQLLLLSNALKQEFGQFEIPAKLTINDALLQRNFLIPFNPNSKNFSEAAVMQGAWLPMNFVRDIGYGLYIDEPLIANKPLLVLVHGMTDSPLRWQALLKKLNYENYQVLRFHYPTGMPLDTDAQVLAKMLERVIARTPNQRMVIIAHSMGGLVSRRAIQYLAAEKKAATVDYFFSVATPWGGHQLAALGATQSPIVVPVWRDLAINSPFLQKLYAQRLPTEINFDLFYATAGGREIFNEPNDGVVTVKSQLDDRAKQEAKHIYAINSAHVAALLNTDTIKAFNAALFSAAIQDEP
jgi:pimeloyl-ACP methyl ester carboxylesterase